MELTFGFLLGGGRGEIKIWWGQSLLGGKFFYMEGGGNEKKKPWSIISYKKLTKETHTS